MNKPLPRPRPCIVTALELIGIDDPTMPEGRLRQVVAAVEAHLGHAESAKLHESHLRLTARNVLHVAPIKRAGFLPFHAALAVTHLQADLVAYGVLVGGAITFGDVTALGDTVFGPGIPQAERLRDEVADVPRVIMDARLLREMERNADLRATRHTPMDELGYVQELLRQDADGLWFVDYLRAFRLEVAEPQMYLDFLKDHRRIVTRRLDESSTLDRRSHMWTWLWSYHNSVVEKLDKNWPGAQQEVPDLHIQATGPLLYKFPPSAKAPG